MEGDEVMFIVALYIDMETVVYHGMFESYDEANDYVLLGIDVEDITAVEIIEVQKVVGEVV